MKKFLIILPMMLAAGNSYAGLIEEPGPIIKEEICINKKICEIGEIFNELTCACEKGGLGGGLELECIDCTGTSWETTAQIGYESKTSAICNKVTGTCTKATLYRCMAGWYGTVVGNTPGKLSGCDVCPNADTSDKFVIFPNSNHGDAITDCYVPANTGMTDATGEYVLTADCHYTE